MAKKKSKSVLNPVALNKRMGSCKFNMLVTDVSILLLSAVIMFYVIKLDRLPCIQKHDWKPWFIVSFVGLQVLIVCLSAFKAFDKMYRPLKELLQFGIAVLYIMYIIVLYNYLREMDRDMRDCYRLNQEIVNVHEFLKLYSLILMLGLVFVVITFVSLIISFLGLPKYS